MSSSQLKGQLRGSHRGDLSPLTPARRGAETDLGTTPRQEEGDVGTAAIGEVPIRPRGGDVSFTVLEAYFCLQDGE